MKLQAKLSQENKPALAIIRLILLESIFPFIKQAEKFPRASICSLFEIIYDGQTLTVLVSLQNILMVTKGNSKRNLKFPH